MDFDLIEPKDYMSEFKKYRKSMFERHAKYVLRTYFNPWAEKINLVGLSKSSELSNQVSGLIIDDRPDEMLRFSVLNTLWMTKFKIPIFIYTTEKSFLSTKKLFLDISHSNKLIKIKTLDVNKINVE